MNPRLLEAAREGDVNKLQTLLNEDEYVIERSSLNDSSETILHVAVFGGKTEFMKRVLEKKPDLAMKLNQDGFGAIHIASANGSAEIVRDLLKFNPALGRLKSSDGRTALHFGAINGSVGVIEQLLELCPSCKDDSSFSGETALHLAVKNCQFEAFKFMVHRLQQSNNIKELLNVGDKDGNTVLHNAIIKRQIPILKFLLDEQEIEKGTINVDVVNKSGLTALDMLDFAQQMVADQTDYFLRELLHHAGASRAKELQSRDDNVTIQDADSFRHESESASRNWDQFFLKEIAILNPVRYYRKLAKEVTKSSVGTQNALMVVAVLIATVTYQPILNPPNGSTNDENAGTANANIAEIPLEFILFMVPNSIGFFASLAVIMLLIHKFPLSSLLGLAVRCMAACYICGLLLIGPTSISVSHRGLLGIGIIVFIDFCRFSCRFCHRLGKEIKKRESPISNASVSRV